MFEGPRRSPGSRHLSDLLKVLGALVLRVLGPQGSFANRAANSAECFRFHYLEFSFFGV